MSKKYTLCWDSLQSVYSVDEAHSESMKSLVSNSESKIVKVYFNRENSDSSEFVEFEIKNKKGDWSTSSKSFSGFFKHRYMKTQLTKDLKAAQLEYYKTTSTNKFIGINLTVEQPEDYFPNEEYIKSEEAYVDLTALAKAITTPILPRRAIPHVETEHGAEMPVTERSQLIYATRLDEARGLYRNNTVNTVSNLASSTEEQNIEVPPIDSLLNGDNELLQSSSSDTKTDNSESLQSRASIKTSTLPNLESFRRLSTRREIGGAIGVEVDNDEVHVEYIEDIAKVAAKFGEKRRYEKGDCRLVEENILQKYPNECDSVALCARDIVPLSYLSTHLQFIQQIDLPRMDKPIIVMPIGISDRGMFRENHVVIAVITRHGIYIIDSKNNKEDYARPLIFLTTKFQSVFNRVDCSRYAAYTAVNMIGELNKLATEKLDDAAKTESLTKKILENTLKQERKSKRNADGQEYDIIEASDKESLRFQGIKFTLDNIQKIVASIRSPKEEKIRKIFDDFE